MAPAAAVERAALQRGPQQIQRNGWRAELMFERGLRLQLRETGETFGIGRAVGRTPDDHPRLTSLPWAWTMAPLKDSAHARHPYWLCIYIEHVTVYFLVHLTAIMNVSQVIIVWLRLCEAGEASGLGRTVGRTPDDHSCLTSLPQPWTMALSTECMTSSGACTERVWQDL
jgi:hypothetical protein